MDILRIAHFLVDPPEGEVGIESIEGLPIDCIERTHAFVDRTIEAMEAEGVYGALAVYKVSEIVRWCIPATSKYASKHLNPHMCNECFSLLCTHFVQFVAGTMLVVDSMAFNDYNREFPFDSGHQDEEFDNAYRAKAYGHAMVEHYLEDEKFLDSAWKDAERAFEEATDEELDEWRTIYASSQSQDTSVRAGKLDPEAILRLPLAFPPQPSSQS